MSDITIRLAALDGSWEEIASSNRARGIRPEGVGLTANEWGPDAARFTLRRDPGVVFPDLTAFTPVEVEVAGIVVWSGFVWETPAVEGADRQIGVEARGWQYHLDDDVFQRVWVHTKLTEWKDMRSLPTTDLGMFKASGTVEVRTGAIVIGWPKGAQADAGQHVGVTLDLGPDSTAKRVVVETEAMNPLAAFTFYVRGHDTPMWGGTVEDIITVGHETMAVAAETRSGTFINPHRHLTIFLHRDDAASGVTGDDYLVRIKSIKVFRDTTYESGLVSIFKASTAVKDALTFAPLLDQSTDEIAATSFDIPDFALTEDRTPREVIDAANALHRWRAMVKPSRKLVFGPQPSVPLLRVGEWDGVEFKDASRNSGQEIYNRALVTGQGPDGEPLKLSRHAAVKPGLVREAVGSPAPANPTFDVDVAGWSPSTGTFVRTTTAGEFDTSPAGGRWAFNAISTRKLTGEFTAGATFKKGVPYVLKLWMRCVAPTAFMDMQVALGVPGGDQALLQWTLSGPGTIEVTWTPSADTPSANIKVEISNITRISNTRTIAVDSLQMFTVRPTLPDRRGFLRTKVQQISPALNPAVAQQFADAYLAGHMRAPLKGSLTAHGSAVRQYQGDAPVHPAHLLLHTTELVHLSHMIDPDTGNLGRDAPIATVSYDHDDQRSDVAVDDTRENFDALVSRYAAIVG